MSMFWMLVLFLLRAMRVGARAAPPVSSSKFRTFLQFFGFSKTNPPPIDSSNFCVTVDSREDHCIVESPNLSGVRVSYTFPGSYRETLQAWQASVAARYDKHKMKYVIDYVTLGQDREVHVGNSSSYGKRSKMDGYQLIEEDKYQRLVVTLDDLPIVEKLDELTISGTCKDALIAWANNILDELTPESPLTDGVVVTREVEALKERMEADPEEAAAIILAIRVEEEMVFSLEKNEAMLTFPAKLRFGAGNVLAKTYWSKHNNHAALSYLIFNLEDKAKLPSIMCTKDNIHFMKSVLADATRSKELECKKKDSLKAVMKSYFIRHPFEALKARRILEGLHIAAAASCVLEAYDVSHRGPWVKKHGDHTQTMSTTWQASVAAKFDSIKKKYVIDYVTYGHTLYVVLLAQSLVKTDESPKRTLHKSPTLSWYFCFNTSRLTTAIDRVRLGLGCEENIVEWGKLLQQSEDLSYEPQAVNVVFRPQNDSAILDIAREVWYASMKARGGPGTSTVSHVFGPSQSPITASIFLLKDATPTQVCSIDFTKPGVESIRIPLLPQNVNYMRSEPHIWQEDESWDIIPTPLVEDMSRQWGLVDENDTFSEAANWGSIVDFNVEDVHTAVDVCYNTLMQPSLAFLLITLFEVRGSTSTSSSHLSAKAKKSKRTNSPKRQQSHCVIEGTHFGGARMAHLHENPYSSRKGASAISRIEIAEPWQVSVGAKLDGDRYVIDYVTLGEKHSIHAYVGDTSWEQLNDETASGTSNLLRWFINPQDLPIAKMIDDLNLSTDKCEEAVAEWGKRLVAELEVERSLPSKRYTEKYNVKALKEMMSSSPREAAVLVVAWIVESDFQRMPEKELMWSESCAMKDDLGTVEGRVYWNDVRDHAMIAIIIFHFEGDKKQIPCKLSSINYMRREVQRLTQRKQEAFHQRDIDELAPKWAAYAVGHPRAFVIAKQLKIPLL
ncbi:hypothetical protein FOL47_001093 [Perkinsus chesapeaki]|uniref:Uncharacterized protein n=1 Tax=Perkinsus chesapeaki TaxID=330153 RepID=A0A7J6MK20_PERCH|nr:hypothetical protein FOL47_001093 [Perkinsus chesapeaki]